MLLKVVKMLKKRLGIEAIERDWENFLGNLIYCYKISSTLIIPEGCRVIGERSFENCVRLKEVKIPESVKEIGISAFWMCDNAEITLKKAKSEFIIGKDAFYNCKSVEYVEEEIWN